MDLIVNADDLGLTPEVNRSIFDLMGRGLVTSASVLANAPFLEDACTGISEFPHCSFGVHLNVTEFHPITGPAKLGPILDHHGAFDGECIRRVAIDSHLADGIFQEFCAQVAVLAARGVPISHIDSHQYVMTIPRMLPILRKVQKRFHIHRMRLGRNIYGPGEKVSSLMRGKKELYNFLLRHYVGARTTQGFAGFDLFYQVATSSGLSYRTFEVVVHPGNGYYPESEIELLRGEWRERLGFPVRLISDYTL